MPDSNLESCSIAGVPIQEYCENVGLRWGENIRKDISDKVREMGATIIKGKGRTHYGIATCVCYLAEAVLNQRLTIAQSLRCSRGNMV